MKKYTKEQILIAAEIGEVSIIDARHVVSLLDEAVILERKRKLRFELKKKGRPLLLDLFCCSGGAGMGYYQAGFDVTGIDIEPQPKYPFKFILSDAIIYLKEHGKEYDFIHASPPCQGYSHLTPKEHKGNYEKLIDVLRELLNEIGKPYCIENVAGAKNELKNPTMLCGSMFNLRTQRHRFFETSFPLVAPCKCDHSELPLLVTTCLLYTSPSPRDGLLSRMPSSA